MRIITGRAKGIRLDTLAGEATRPTAERVKEAVFSMLQFDLGGRRVLDLFAGTGQLGIEALSRGAESAVFVDSSNKAVALIKENISRCGFEEFSTVLRSDWKDALRRQREKFDIIFLDPPYDTQLLKNSLKTVAEIDILAQNGIIVCESRADTELPELGEPYERKGEYRYGAIKLTLYTKKGKVFDEDCDISGQL